LKVCYVCECCGELLSECGDGVALSELNGNVEPLVNSISSAEWVVVKTMCDECLVALGRTDDGFTGWISGVNVFRH